MKFKWDKKYLYWGVTALVVLSISCLIRIWLSEMPLQLWLRFYCL